jgi:hypothetical protein
MEEIMRRIILAFALAGIFAEPAFGQGVDPLLGTWKFNPEKSTSTGLLLGKSAVNTYAMEGQIIVNTIEGIDDQATPYKRVLQHIYDGMPHPIICGTFDTTAYTRIGNTINLIRFRQWKAGEVGQGVIVPGKTLTFTSEGITANGQPYHSVVVYDRQ